MGVRTRVPGRRRFGGIFSGDYGTFYALFGFGFLFTAFFNLDRWHRILFGQSTADFPAVLGLLAICLAFAWRVLLRRGFVWAEPAELTWLDFARADRRRVVGARLLVVWSAVVLAAGYAVALVVAAGGGGRDVWTAGVALVAACAVLIFATARRTALRADVAGPLVLAVTGLVIAAAALGPLTVQYVAGGVLIVACGLALGGEPVTGAGRLTLVEGWNVRVLRAVAVTFMDPMLVLPESAPVGRLSLRRPTALRLAWAGFAGRTRYLGAAVLLALGVAVARVAVPTLPAAILVGLGAFIALVPFGGGLGVLWRNPGRRRWLATSDWELRVTHGLLLAILALGWSALLVAVSLLVGATVPVIVWLAVPLAVLAVLRAVTRKEMDYTDGRGFSMARQFVRGVDVLVIGILVLSVKG
ncbi:hypothetical protein [Amycolatopsis sp. NPDC058986]|uniref:hypothetical protein n=1 Tax=unclassified Amycolatopsis TaxID=2618356 RepID=UPI00366C1B83